MADRYTGALGHIERTISQTIDVNRTNPQFLELVVMLSDQKLSSSDAMKILEIYFDQYRRQNRPNAQKYCTFEMERLLAASRNPQLQSIYPMIDFSGVINQSLIDFVERKRPIYAYLTNAFLTRWIGFSTLFLILFLAVAVLLFRGPFLIWFLILLAVWFYLQWYGKNREVPYMVQRRMEALYDSLDPEHLELIEGWDLQTPSYLQALQARKNNRKKKRK